MKIYESLRRRKSVPGLRLATIRENATYRGQLVSFQYISYGNNPERPVRNTDIWPLLILAYKDSSRVWKAKNGRSYIYGFNLNYLPAKKRLEVLKSLREFFEDDQDLGLTYQQLKERLQLPASVENSIFRKYEVGGGKLKFLKEVDLDTYVHYLDYSINNSD